MRFTGEHGPDMTKMENRKMHLIHVHGFSEPRAVSIYTEAYLASLKPLFDGVDIEEFKWGTETSPTKLAQGYAEDMRRTTEVAGLLAAKVEKIAGPVILSGFSLGGAIVLKCLKKIKSLEHLSGVVILGAAIDAEFAPPSFRQNKTCLRLNYFSSVYDLTLRVGHYSATGKNAAGTKGLIHPNGFQNLETRCSHTSQNPLAESSYVRLIPAISTLLAWQHGIRRPGEAHKPWQGPLAIGKGNDWDDIYRLNGHIIQQHWWSRKYRAIEDGSVHREICWSDELWPVLDCVDQS